MSRATPPASLLTLTAPPAAPAARAPEEGFSDELDSASSSLTTSRDDKPERSSESEPTDEEDGSVESVSSETKHNEEESPTASQSNSESEQETNEQDDVATIAIDGDDGQVTTATYGLTDIAGDAADPTDEVEAVSTEKPLLAAGDPSSTEANGVQGDLQSSELSANDLSPSTGAATENVDAVVDQPVNQANGPDAVISDPNSAAVEAAVVVDADSVLTGTPRDSLNESAENTAADPDTGQLAIVDSGSTDDSANRHEQAAGKPEHISEAPINAEQASAVSTSANSDVGTGQTTTPTPAPTTEAAAIGPLQSADPNNPIAESRPATQEPPQPPAIDPARFVSRVARAFDFAQQRGGGPIEIRLSPPELGAVQLKLELSEGVLTASLETETQAARNALLDNLPALRERLAEQDIRVEKFDVDVRDEGRQPDLPEQNDNDSERNEERSSQPSTIDQRGSQEADDKPNSNNAQTIRFTEDGINLVA